MFKRRSLAFKVFITIFLVAIITTTLATGTLASFSAIYTWQSNEGTIGTFDYSDTTLQISLFDNAPIYPSDSGSAVLSGDNFLDHTLSWGFSQTNDKDIPLLYYVDNGLGFCGFYSSYDYAINFPEFYIKLDNTTYVACAQISTEAINLAQNFAISSSVCWVWADKFFALADDTYTEVVDNTAVNAFLENNNALCKSIKCYSYDDAQMLPLVSSTKAKFSYIAISQNDEVYTIADFVGASVSISNGLFMSDGSYLSLYSVASGDFITPNANYTLSSGDYYLLGAKPFSFAHLDNALTQTTLNYEVVENDCETGFTPYYFDTVNYTMYTSEAEPRGPLVKLFPCELSYAPTVSVVITVEVTI